MVIQYLAHPCRTPNVVLNQFPVVPLNRIALWAFSSFNDLYDVGIDVVFTHSYPWGFMPPPVKNLLEIYEDLLVILLMLHTFLAEDQSIEHATRENED